MLEGVAHRGADLVDAAVADGVTVDVLRVDGGMTDNPTFVQALADATGRVIEVARLTEATTLGAAYLAGLATGMWSSLDEIADAWRPRVTVEPGRRLDRAAVGGRGDACRRMDTRPVRARLLELLCSPPANKAGRRSFGKESARVELEPPVAGENRRSLAKRLLGIGLGGAAVAIVPQLAGRAGATTPPGTGDVAGSTPTTVAVTTTTAPKRPTPEDVERLVPAQQVEISAYRLYLASRELNYTDEQRTVLDVIGQSHLSYAQALSGFLGREASNDADEALVAERLGAVHRATSTPPCRPPTTSSRRSSARTSSRSARSRGTDAVNLLSSIVTVEGRNGTVLADLMGETDFAVLLVDNEADAIETAKG